MTKEDSYKSPGNKNIILHPKHSPHKYTIVWLHGLGDTSEGFLDFFLSGSSVVPPHTRVVLLTAPERRVTINMGMKSTSWYDILDLSFKPGKDVISDSEVQESFIIISK